MNILTLTPPAEEPVSREQAKQHCRIEDDASDTLIDSYITAAREMVEGYTRLRLITQTVQVRTSGFAHYMPIPMAPVQDVSEVAYLDAAGVLTLVDPADYRLALGAQPVGIVPAYEKSWPDALCEPDSVRITVSVGYGGAAAVPAAQVVAIKLLVGHFFDNRESVVIGASGIELPLGVKDILTRYVLWV